MKASPNLIISIAVAIIFLTALSDYHSHTTTLAVNEKLQEVGKTDLIKEAKFPFDIWQYLLWGAFLVYGITKRYSKDPNA